MKLPYKGWCLGQVIDRPRWIILVPLGHWFCLVCALLEEAGGTISEAWSHSLPCLGHPKMRKSTLSLWELQVEKGDFSCCGLENCLCDQERESSENASLIYLSDGQERNQLRAEPRQLGVSTLPPGTPEGIHSPPGNLDVLIIPVCLFKIDHKLFLFHGSICV